MTRRRWTYTIGGRPLPEPVEVTEGAEPEGFNATEGIVFETDPANVDRVRADLRSLFEPYLDAFRDLVLWVQLGLKPQP